MFSSLAIPARSSSPAASRRRARGAHDNRWCPVRERGRVDYGGSGRADHRHVHGRSAVGPAQDVQGPDPPKAKATVGGGVASASPSAKPPKCFDTSEEVRSRCSVPCVPSRRSGSAPVPRVRRFPPPGSSQPAKSRPQQPLRPAPGTSADFPYPTLVAARSHYYYNMAATSRYGFLWVGKIVVWPSCVRASSSRH